MLMPSGNMSVAGPSTAVPSSALHRHDAQHSRRLLQPVCTCLIRASMQGCARQLAKAVIQKGRGARAPLSCPPTERTG